MSTDCSTIFKSIINTELNTFLTTIPFNTKNNPITELFTYLSDKKNKDTKNIDTSVYTVIKDTTIYEINDTRKHPWYVLNKTLGKVKTWLIIFAVTSDMFKIQIIPSDLIQIPSSSSDIRIIDIRYNHPEGYPYIFFKYKDKKIQIEVKPRSSKMDFTINDSN